MPPSVVKTVRDLIFWQYAKIISASAGIGRKDYGFVMMKFKQLRQGEIFWNEIREYVKEKANRDECIFCDAKTNLTLEHLFPLHFNRPDAEKNVVWEAKSATRQRAREGFTSTSQTKEASKPLNTTCIESPKEDT